MQDESLRRQLTATESNRLSEAEVDQFLSERRIGYLGTVSRSGHAHITPIWFWHEDGTAYFLLGSGRVHLAHLRVSPKATLLVEEDLRPAHGMPAGARAVLIKGVATELTDPAEFARIKYAIDRKYLGDDADDPGYHEVVSSDTYLMWSLPARPAVSWKLG